MIVLRLKATPIHNSNLKAHFFIVVKVINCNEPFYYILNGGADGLFNLRLFNS